MIKRVEIENIINYLNTITDITDIVWNRIYWWVPNKEPWEIYIMITSVINSQVNNLIEWYDRLEIRVVSWSDSNKWSEVSILDNLVINALASETNYNWFEVYRTVPLNGVSLYTDNNRKEYVRDYQIHFIN